MDFDALARLERLLDSASHDEPELLRKRKLNETKSSLTVDSVSIPSGVDSDEINKDSAPSSSSNTHNDVLSILSVKISPWQKYYDPVSCKFYYHNRETNITQWEIPDGYIDQTIDSQETNALTNDYSSSSMYKSTATFSTTKGVFGNSGAGSYWDKVQRPNDRGKVQINILNMRL